MCYVTKKNYFITVIAAINKVFGHIDIVEDIILCFPIVVRFTMRDIKFSVPTKGFEENIS